ncbi:MAG: formate dehydrogenase subunit beta, partial [Burkholderiaceae bacterium]|nr:formate dehydrogenase subunit beta [Burkholderiaceae bacterium]
LPANPSISPTVGVWKGVMKPIALIAMAAAVLTGVVHYAVKGPKVVEEDHDDIKA